MLTIRTGSRSTPIATVASACSARWQRASLPAQIIAADLDGGSMTDLVVRNAADGSLSVFLNNRVLGHNSCRPFYLGQTIPVGLRVSDVQAIDTTGSGLPTSRGQTS